MDDKFLYQLREQPDVDFVRDLYRKISQKTARPPGRTGVSSRLLPGRINLVRISALLGIGLLAMMAISPVRAFVSSLILDIAGQSFEVTEDYPGDNHPGEETIIDPQVMPLEEALALYPYKVRLPSSVPAGFVLNEQEVRVYLGEQGGPFANSMEVAWQSEEGTGFHLRISDQVEGISEVVAPDSTEEILLDENHPAVLIRGGWDADRKEWGDEHGLRLRWTTGQLLYDLYGTDREQLIEIALTTLE